VTKSPIRTPRATPMALRISSSRPSLTSDRTRLWTTRPCGSGLREPRRGSLVEARVDADLAGERALDAVDPGRARVAGLAVGGVDLRVAQPHRHALERKLLAAGAEAQRHAGAGAKRSGPSRLAARGQSRERVSWTT